MVQTEHASWLVDILYPTFEELQIPPEDVDFVRQQMTKEDFKDDAFYVDFEAEALLN
ncbi:MAG: hypothetical protein PF450_02010 [Bacteroidales bacterium]|jgi:hypothetical protein|nr:hypothetical protein [Bacteroidales bacterium]